VLMVVDQTMEPTTVSLWLRPAAGPARPIPLAESAERHGMRGPA
jgi:hypothetical protein